MRRPEWVSHGILGNLLEVGMNTRVVMIAYSRVDAVFAMYANALARRCQLAWLSGDWQRSVALSAKRKAPSVLPSFLVGTPSLGELLGGLTLFTRCAYPLLFAIFRISIIEYYYICTLIIIV